MQTSHHSALEAKHASLDRRICEEAGRPQPDSIAIASLKRQKLRLKEALSGR